MSVTLTLKTPQGKFVFTDAEVPESIAFGGQQMLTTHKLVGGLRVVDTMGPDDMPLGWSGWFLGSTAGDRSRYLDYLRRSGPVCTLTWDSFNYSVTVQSFKAEYQKAYKIPYQIAFEVVQDNTKPVKSITPISPTDAINQDSSTLSTLAAAVGIPSLSSAVSSATSALSSVVGAAKPIASGLVSLGGGSGSGIAGAVSGAISSALSATISSTVTGALNSAISAASGALAAVQSQVSGLISTAESAVASIPSIGGLNPLQSIAQQAAGMASQAVASAQLSTLSAMSDVTSRLQSNLAVVTNPGGNKVATTGGGSLYAVAQQAYGDATRWTDIAQASGLTDPITTGFNQITIPQS